ncbi:MULTISPECIES: hypothetical protein [Streptomyces]|uniref:Uncharacterized protein n=1 Tax=Streptomyces rubiginosohelvolus TaxID=67362 RepID=A0ABQ3BDY0_9ACTN|nr:MULTISPECIES: hypothetical protein [Streptomyces]RUP69168.1 hypothetical protein SSPNP10_05395 [Streptomyces sp. NP10]GGR74839.1 hypothetical protein GCM10010284_04490 [Streptomyces rubiginosohelvolus]GGZ38854.1 hypothetical protein GCM10010328_10940 [Streptomyces pluricolorescens]
MATPAPTPEAKEEAWIRPFWINKKDIEHQKELYRDLQHSVTLIKYELGGLALGLTLVKADFTILKADEKGITLRGRQLVTFPWADPKKSLQERIDRLQAKVQEDQQSINNKVSRLETMKKDAEGGRDKARDLREGTGSGGRADAARKVMQIRFDIANDVHRATALEKKVDRQVTKIETRVQALSKLDARMELIKKKEEELKKAGAEANKNAQAAQTSVKQLGTNLRATQRQVVDVSRALSG